MIGVKIDQLVSAPIRVKREGAREVGSGNHVPEVPVDGIDEKHFADVVPIVPPWIGRPGRQNFDRFA